MLVLLLRHLLISFHRELTREHILKNEYLDHEMDLSLIHIWYSGAMDCMISANLAIVNGDAIR